MTERVLREMYTSGPGRPGGPDRLARWGLPGRHGRADEPGAPERPALSGRQRAADGAIALAVTAAQLAAACASGSWGRAGHHGPGWSVYVLLGLAGMSLIGRRRFPVAVLAASLALTLWASAIGGAGMIWIALIAAFLNAAIAGKRAAAAASLVIGYLASFWPVWRIGQAGHASTAVALAVAAWLLALLAVAELIRSRRQRAAALRLRRDDQFRRRASEERMRMARDLHDVLVHNISVINVQANAALHLMDRQPERAREALTAIHGVSKQALAELRSVLGVLRDGGEDEDAPRTPGPGLRTLPDLVAAVRSAGLDVQLTVAGDARPLPADADIAAYRLVQESLTNVTRHSAAGSAAVRVRFGPAGVAIEVEDAGGRGRPPAAQGSSGPVPGGTGIAGMAARVGEIGGTFAAGPGSAGGFLVSAWLPAAALPAAALPGADESGAPVPGSGADGADGLPAGAGARP